MINKQSTPPLESRITAMLNNPNSESEALYEIIASTELAIVTADETMTSERAKAVDLTSTPSAEAAQDAISRAEAATINRDRLQSALPKLRDKLAGALRSEEHERWLSDFIRVRQKRDEAAAVFETYSEHAQAIVQMFALAEQVDKEISRINGQAPDGEHLRLRAVELEARDLDGFTINNPSLASTVELRDWNNSEHKLWPLTSSGSLAAAFAETMMVPYHPGAAWSDPAIQAQRRAEQEKQNRETGKNYQRMTAEQEDRINREERERFAASQNR